MVKRNQDEKEAKIQELYSGGRSIELIWIAHLDDACYNKPIETALWNNNEEDLKAWRSPPEWKPSYDKRILPNKWSRVTVQVRRKSRSDLNSIHIAPDLILADG